MYPCINKRGSMASAQSSEKLEREMDQTKLPNFQALSEYRKSEFPKKVTQLLLSVSVFSLFFSNSTWLSFLFHGFNFPSFLFQLITHTINRSYIFLLCNGILVFLARTSGLISSSSSGFDHANEYFRKIGDGLPLFPDKEVAMEMDTTTGPTKNTVVDDDQEERDGECFKEEETENLTEEEETKALDDGASDVEDEEAKESRLESHTLVIEEEEEEGEHWSLSNEELNKKFDDFIRRTKEEIRIGSMTTSHSLVTKESFLFDQSVY